MSELINQDNIIPAAILGGFLLSRLHSYRFLRRVLPPAVIAGLVWRCRNDPSAVSVLDLIVIELNKHFSCAAWSSLFVKDLVGVLILAAFVKVLSSHVTFNTIELKQRIGDVGFGLLSYVPSVAKKMDSEKAKMEGDVEKSLKAQLTLMGEVNRTLPKAGKNTTELLRTIGRLARKDDTHWRDGRVSGAVYLGDKDHMDFLNKVFGFYSISNPLHASVWPSLMKFESEVIAMTAAMVNGGDEKVVGCVSSGGTESIILAIKAHRDYYRNRYGITEPELVCCVTAHAAVFKGCDLLGVKLVRVPMDPDTCKVDLGAMERAIGPNTIMLYSSAPSFPHGAIDPISALSNMAVKYSIGLHVDCCLGGFVLPFAKKLGYEIPAFDFSLPGVTTMSCDTHKYGYALKGSSVLLFRNTEYRQAMYFCYSDWSGGVYATPTIAGSKSGGMVAQTWASMMAMGEDGYMNHVNEIMETARAIADGVRNIKGLRIMGGASAMLVCFTGTDGLNIYRVHDKMTTLGWHLNAVQNPPAMNICVTAKHVGQDQQLLRDLRDSVRFVHEHPDDARGSTATLYGTTAALPPGPVNELVKVYLDVVYKTAPL